MRRDTPATTATRLGRAAARLAHGDLGAALVAAALTLLLAVLVLRLWRADLAQPIDTRGVDTHLVQLTVKGMLDHGWYQTNPDLGAPLGQQLYDFAAFSATNLHYAAMRVIGLFSSDYAVVLNIYYLLGFVLTAVAAVLTFRWLRISRPVAIACACVFALLPDHFIRGQAHLSLSEMFVVPAAAYLILAVLEGEPLLARREHDRGRVLLRYASRRSIITLALATMIGASDFYYASFTIILVAVAGVLRLAASRRFGELATVAVVIVAIGGTLGLDLLPNFLYERAHTPNKVFTRAPWESDFYGLTIARLVTPIETHRIPALATVGREYDSQTRASGEGPLDHIGLISSAGLLALFAAALAACIGARGLLSDARVRRASLAAIALLLVATVGGGSELIAFWITPQLRAWGRAAPFIAFFSLIAVAVLLDALGGWLPTTRRGRMGFRALLGGVVCVAVFDQTSNSFVPDYAGQAALSRSTNTLVRSIEARLPPGSEVFQLPYEGFPEAPPSGRRHSYDSAIPYLHSRRLRWSYGAMRGRPADWADKLSDRSPDQIASATAAVGFAGILVDRLGYPALNSTLEAGLAQLTRGPPLVSPDGRYAFFDLRSFRDAQRRRSLPQQLAALRRATLGPGR